ncbi:MAG: insulinase family protein [Saprospiraceae bacterium]|nr:insulinase family protein [Saprospiraceae bacterium]MDP4812455.1 insulinase family protein [Saprospiraceae bacterium]MDP5047932.1 insulinase family protein [Saprospiraceae bacterium]
MISYEKMVLQNGLTVLMHEDKNTPIASISVLYKVGSRDEHPEKTGFAHLFEHLMFGGSINIPDYDGVMQRAGGENNAYTNHDYTHFFTTLPAINIETALWLESDRMLELMLQKEVLDVQKKVVVEEFYETCLNLPYGDVWHELSALNYEKHPYKWPTIGVHPSHIEKANLTDVKKFYNKYYHPGNAILVIAGPISIKRMKELARKWFNDIPSGKTIKKNYSSEPPKKEARHKQSQAEVPVDAIYMTFPCPARADKAFYAVDLLSDIFSNGPSSRLIHRLTRENKYFNQIDCYVTGDFDPGLIVFEGRPTEKISLQDAEEIICKEINDLKNQLIESAELQKWKNKAESTLVLSEMGIQSKSMNLGFFEALGNADLMNAESKIYQSLTAEEIQQAAKEWLRDDQKSVLTYKGK